MKSGNVAVQQALIKYFFLSYRMTAAIMGVNHRTVWQHVNGGAGSNVASWEARPENIKEEAIVKAQLAINEYALKNR